MKKCLVKGCENQYGDGEFVGDLCRPCYNMLSEGRLIPSKAWFAEEIRRKEKAASADYAHKAKLELQQAILELISAFEDKTGMRVSDIRQGRAYQIGRGSSTVAVEITVELP